MWIYFFNSMNSECRSSISKENLVSESRYARNVNYTPEFEDCIEKKKEEDISDCFYTDDRLK